jgi:uncharacterized protein (DUF1697 family)
MTRYVAFLRAINVGGHIVKMDQLRGHFQDLGFANVQTFIGSGNVIFESKSKSIATLEKKIAATLEEALGYRVDTFVRSLQELAEVAQFKAFADDDPKSTLFVMFTAAALSKEAKRDLLSCATPVDQFNANGREVYWLCRGKFKDSLISSPAKLEKIIRMPGTVRNFNTVRRILAKYS